MGVAAPIIMSLASAAMTQYNNQQVAKKQDNILAQQLQRNALRQQEADQAVGDTIRERATQGGEGERASIGAQYLDQVRSAQSNAQRGLGQVGAVSNAYQQDANNAALGIGDYGAQMSDLMARIDAPMAQRQRESISAGRLSSDLDQIGRRGRSDDYLTQLRLQGVRGNPWLELGAAGLGAAAGAMSSSGWGQESLAGIQAGAKANADFGNVNRQLASSYSGRIADLMAGRAQQKSMTNWGY